MLEFFELKQWCVYFALFNSKFLIVKQVFGELQ